MPILDSSLRAHNERCIFLLMQASPMHVKYSITWEQYLTQEVVDEMVSSDTYIHSSIPQSALMTLMTCHADLSLSSRACWLLSTVLDLKRPTLYRCGEMIPLFCRN